MNRFSAPDVRNDVRAAGPAIALVAVNCIPMLGALLWGWTLFDIVMLYWFENVVIGGVNILKMVTCAPDEAYLKQRYAQLMQRAIERSGLDVAASPACSPEQPAAEQTPAAEQGMLTSAIGHQAAKLLLVPFFTVHYGMFCFVHGIFVMVLLAGGGGMMSGGPVGLGRSLIAELGSGGLLVAALGLMASHLYSYLFHFLGRGEFRRTTLDHLMFAPYGRIFVLHIAILFGAFATMFLGQPLVLVALLIIGKTLLDWRMHVREHRMADAAPAGDAEVLWQQDPAQSRQTESAIR